ncbi:MAG: NAD(P)H-hydrate dehydratase [Planctomycetota bacterium]
MQPITQIPSLPPRRKDAHKGDFGKVCIIAGSAGMAGAAAIAGRAALRAGSGLVRVALPREILPVVASIEPCFTTIPLAADKQGRIASKAVNTVLNLIPDNDVFAFGPGVGIAQGPKDVLLTLLAQPGLRLIIDADGLNNLAGVNDWIKIKKASVVLTPHPGEMKRLWNAAFRDKLPSERVEQALRLAQAAESVVVLKGAGTVVTDGEKLYVNTTGNPGMATAGAGDVLTGVITSLAGQGLSTLDAAVLGVYIHGLAGDLAAKKFGQAGLIATDIIDELGSAFADRN